MQTTKLENFLVQQKKKFVNTSWINFIFLIGLFIFLAINIYSDIKKVNNPEDAIILIYIALVALIFWDATNFIKNLIGIKTLNNLKKIIFETNHLSKIEVLSFPNFRIFFGSYYVLIEAELKKLVGLENYVSTKQKQNLKFLNIKLALVSVFLFFVGISFLVAMVIYFKKLDVNHWSTIVSLVALIIFCIGVFGYAVPRQIILNQKIKLKNRHQIDEYTYFFKWRFFALRNTLTKFWNPISLDDEEMLLK